MKKYRNELGQYHRTDGPAIEDNYSKEWFINGLRHRTDGPAIKYSDGHKEWYINGKLHREDGPAVDCSDYKQWWINGKKYAEEEYHQEILKLFHERLKEEPESAELKQDIKKLETKLTAKKYGL